MKHPIQLYDTIPVFYRIRKAPNKVVRSILINALIFFVYILAASLAESIVMALFGDPEIAFGTSENGVTASVKMTRGLVILMLYLTLISIALTFVYCCSIEKRKVRTLGLCRRSVLRDYLIGTLAGIGMMTAVVLLAWAGGGLTCRGVAKSIPWGPMLLFLFGWMIQGFSEELTFRGYLMMTTGTHHNPLAAVAVSSLAFAAAHLGNDGISIFAFVNLTLFGVLAALLFLRTDSIWCVAAVHSFWNMAQGNLFGLKVSGIDVSATFFRFDMTEGKTWLNGGAFGLEGGAATTVVMLLGIVVVFLLPQRTPEPSAPPIAVQA
jgi:hypothetical protein